MKRIYTKDTINKTGEEVKVCGWVDARRDHGKLIFIDLRDMTGILQVVFTPEDKEALELANELRPNFTIELTGIINERPDNMINEEIETGKIELQAKDLVILNKSETTPFELDETGYDVKEELRLKYRYIDLKRQRLQKNIRMRHKIIQFARNFLNDENFVEIETPLLTKATPEGARDFIVPSRLQHGKFYALPQAPQQFKQLLMVSGFEKYFQIAKCLRDEDTRGDRQPEFTQLDMEMSFVDREDVMTLNEKLIIETVKNLYPEKEITETPFPRMTYKEAMEKYGSDRPDIRKDKNNPNELGFLWVIDFPFFARTEQGRSEKVDKGSASHAETSAVAWTFTHNPFSAAIPEWKESLVKKENIGEIIAAQYDLVLNGFEIGGGSIRNHEPEALKSVLEIIGHNEKDIEKDFGHMLQAFTYGAPPHGGIAFGLDRLVAILQNEPNIREVIAFPKTGDGRDLMVDAPAEIGEEQLKELGIEVTPEEKKEN